MIGSILLRQRFNKIINKIMECCKADEKINGLLLFGSQATGNNLSFYSDIDFIVITYEEKSDGKQFLINLKIGLMDINEEIAYKLQNKDKLVIFLQESFLKLEFQFLTSEKLWEIKKFFQDIKFENLDRVVLVDKNKKIKTKVSDLIHSKEILDKKIIFNELISDFLYYFDLASNQLKRGDSYAFYFEYNIAFHRLVQIISLYYEHERLFLPRNIFSILKTDNEKNKLQNLSCNLKAEKAYEKKKALFDFFLDTLDKIAKIYEIDFSKKELIFFKEKIDERDLIWNFRDIGFYIDGNKLKIKKGKIFRSSKIIFTYPDDEILTLIRNKNIKTIIDLRTKVEILKRPYTANITQEVKYFNFPFFEPDKIKNQVIQVDANQTELQKSYLHLVIDYKDEIKKIFEILADERNYNILIHCVAGKDRTGFVIMLIELLLGITKEDIIFDYLSSGIDTDKDLIQIPIDYIENQGGIFNYLKNIGISTNQLNKIREILFERIK